MGQLFFTSDLHLDHENLLKNSDRPFETIQEMNEVLIKNINDTVSSKSELWILGDFGKGSKERIAEFRRQICCKHVHLILGNHDRENIQDGIFDTVKRYHELKTNWGRVCLFHNPIREWNGAHYGAIHLHGHIHSDGSYNTENLKKRYVDWMIPCGHPPIDEDMGLRIYDVGVDANSFRPVSLDYIASLMHLNPVK